MSNRPRTPQHFPRMKVRGKARRKQPRIDRARFAAVASTVGVVTSGIVAAAVLAMSQFSAVFARIQAMTDATNKQMAEIALNAQAASDSTNEAMNAFGLRAARGATPNE